MRCKTFHSKSSPYQLIPHRNNGKSTVYPQPNSLIFAFHPIYKNSAIPTANRAAKLNASGTLNVAIPALVDLVVPPEVVELEFEELVVEPEPELEEPLLEEAVEPAVPSVAMPPGARFCGADLAICM